MFRACILAVVVLAAVGCSPSGQGKTYPVKGHVMFEGKPMQGGGAISLIPTTDQRGKTAAGTIKPDGSYVLGTYREADGSMVGEFRVIIFQGTGKEVAAAAAATAPSAAATSTAAPADRIPVVYASDRQS